MNRLNIYILTAIITLFSFGAATAQTLKMVENSTNSKNAPEWINNLQRGYIIATASESSIEAAKQAVIVGVKQQIAQSIVSNVSVEFMHTSLTVETQSSAAFQSETIDIVRSTTDKIPFLQSISLTKASDFYWEKYFDKKSGQTRYDYYIKYAFSDFELDKLVAEFNAKQAEINKTIERMAQEIDTFIQIEDIAKNMGILRALVPEFADGDPRIKVIDELVNRYRDQYKYISIEEIENQDKRVVLQTYLSGRAVETAQVPTHKSNGADRIKKSVAKGVIEITYDDYVCKAGDDNWIDITFRFGSRIVTHRINIIK